MGLENKWINYGLVLFSLAAIAGLYFDGYWHVAIGRETFFIPPHIIMYSSLILMFFCLYKTKHNIPKITWLFAATLLLAAPFDNWWHEIFGPEKLNTIWVVWSPPHLVGELSMWALLFIVFKKLVAQKAGYARTLQWAAFTALVLFTVSPLSILGPYSVGGFFGGLAQLFVMGLLIHVYFRVIKEPLWKLLVPVFLIGLPFGLQETVTNNFPAFHAHPPFWIMAIVFLLPAVIVDLFFNTKKAFVKTGTFLFFHVLFYLGIHPLLFTGYAPIIPSIVALAILTLPIAYIIEKTNITKYIKGEPI